MKRRHLWLTALCLIISIFSCVCLAACNSCGGKGEGKPVALAIPQGLAVDKDGKATWNEVANASGYAYKIDDGEEQSAPDDRTVQLSDGQAIAVKAVGDGVKYKDSAYSASVRYTVTIPDGPVALKAPAVEITTDAVTGTVKAVWGEVTGATGYTVQFMEEDDEDWDTFPNAIKNCAFEINEGMSVRVKALGDGENYTDSGWSNVVTRPAGGTSEHTHNYKWVDNGDGTHKQHCAVDGCDLPDKNSGTHVYGEDGKCVCGALNPNTSNPDKPGVPTIYIDDNGAVSWTDIADSYEVEIEGDKTYSTTLNYMDVRLTDGQSIRIRAINYDENGYYVYGDWSDWETFEEPELQFPNGIKFVFKEGNQNTNGYSSSKELNDIFNEASKDTTGFEGVTLFGGIFREKNPSNALRFGSSKQQGTITLSFKKEVVMVIINCKKYNNDNSTVTVNNDSNTAQNPEATQGDLVYTLATPAKTVTITSEKRSFIFGITVFYAMPETLEKPEVEIDPYGVATWEEVANASGYTYTVNGEDKGFTTERSVKLNDGESIIVTAVGDGINYLSSTSDEKTYTEQQFTLEKPVVTISRNIAFWDIDKHASGYEYRIDGGAAQTAPAEGGVTLTSGQTIEVRALGDGNIFADSDWSEPVTFNFDGTAVKLGAPVITIERDGTASWTNNPANHQNDAAGYEVKVNGTAAGETVKLNDGDTITVKALGDGVYFADSDEAQLTYTAPANHFEAPTNLTVVIEGVDKGVVVVSWDAVDGTSGYAYVINDGYDNAVTTSDTTAKVDLSKIDATKLGDTWSFRVMALGDGNNEVAEDGDYSSRFEASEYCEIVEFRVERGDDEKVYTVSEILKVINYFGKKNLPDDTFTVSGTVSANTAYGENIDITLKEGTSTFLLEGAAVPADYAFTPENLLNGTTVKATGKLAVSTVSGVEVKKLAGSDAEIVFEALADRYALAAKLLNGMDELQEDTQHTEDFDLPVALYGVNVDWDVTADDNVFVIDGDGHVTVTQPEASAKDDAYVMLEVSLYYGEMEDIYDEDLLFSVVVPKIVLKPLDTPKINIDANTGVATWTAVEGADGYYYTIEGWVDNDYSNPDNYVYETGEVLADEERVVQLRNKLTLEVIAYSESKYYEAFSNKASKPYNYYPATTTPAGTPLKFDFKDIPQNDSNELKNPKSFFVTACGSSADFKSVTTSNVYLGNSSSVSASHVGGGFLKSGSSSTNGKITLTFGKKVNGVIIECQTWNEDTHDKVSVNGSDEQIAKKNGWGTLTFSFDKSSETVEIITNKRVFIKSITVYLAD